MIEKELPCTMEFSYFKLEADVRCVLINTLFRKRISVWDCQGEAGKCPDPIKINNIPMRIAIGDIPIFHNTRYYIIEVKFNDFFCRYRSKRGGFAAVRDPPQIIEAQSQMLLRGEGLLILVAEPPPSKVGLNGFFDENKGICEEKLNKNFKRALGSSNISYDVWLLDFLRFEKYWNNYLKNASIKEVKRDGVKTLSRYLSYQKLESILPEAKISLTMKEIKIGKIADLIIELLN